MDDQDLLLTRRHFFGLGAAGIGGLALDSLLGPDLLGLKNSVPTTGTHFRPTAKRVIYMHMEGAPSQLDLFDYKPGLQKYFNQELPESIRQGQRLTGMTSGQARFPIAPSVFKFNKYANNQDGVWLSELLPHTASLAKDMCLIRSMHTDAINHEPALTFFNTGSQQVGRASFGSWMSYGLGNANANLPAFVVMISQGAGNMQALAARMWGSGFLPSEHQGCKLRAGDDPVLYLNNPKGVSRDDRRKLLDLSNELNEKEYQRTFDPEIRSRISQYEMAYRMQMSVPELTDISDEDDETLEMYGKDVHTQGSFASNCLRARRLAERGVRFIQLFHRGWDQHNNLPNEIKGQTGAVDRAQAALVKDLKRRGLLDDTIILWAGEFGRSVYSQGALTKTNYGRDHHPRCFSVWLAGGGIKPGIVYGKTDDHSYNIAENPVSVHDLHATMLHCLGFDHKRLDYFHQGREMRLTDVFGNVIKPILQ
ncbi:MAG: sulfatase [Planctomycetes bacterium]|nr:sulfatase [Planctomycetota bacterium]